MGKSSAEYQRQYRLKNRERLNRLDRERYRREREKRIVAQREYKTGVSEAEYNAKFLEQGGVCAVCHTPPPSSGWITRLGADHDHKTGKFRGILCARCNAALGQAADSPARLRALADYLERTQ